MAKKKTQIPKYGTITLKGIQYYRTRITDADATDGQGELIAVFTSSGYRKESDLPVDCRHHPAHPAAGGGHGQGGDRPHCPENRHL